LYSEIDDDLKPYFIKAEQVMNQEKAKLKRDKHGILGVSRKYLIAEAMMAEYLRISNRRKKIRLATARADYAKAMKDMNNAEVSGDKD
jgi:hypothetical protein